MYLWRELLCNLWWWPLNLLRSWLVCKLVWNPSWFHGLPGYTVLSLLNRPLVGWFSYLISYNWSVLLHTISKQAESSFHLNLVTMECYWVRPKWFLSLWFVWRKPCTYLALTLILSPNAPNRDSTWPKSPSSYIGCVQNDFWACRTFGAKRAPILRQD
jgi:hypothetical protein